MTDRPRGDDQTAVAPTAPSGDPGPSQPSDLRRLATGATIAERYDVVRFLAAGAMGEVYEARDRMLDAVIALKTIRPAIARDPQMVERFKREIQLARKVTHPNVCRVFEVGLHEGIVFLTMELLVGETLAERIRHGRMTAAEARPIVLQLAAGLAAAHEAGVVHRDFKPHNVIVVESKGSSGIRAVVTDFGVARGFVDEPGAAILTGGSDLIGTPAYMAPEQVRADKVGPPCDVYALGLVMYEMVTGKLPFAGTTALAIASARLTDDPAAPRTLVPELEPSFDAIVVRCLAREPADRPSMIDVGVALRAEHSPRAPKRRRMLLIGACVAALAAGIMTWWWIRTDGTAASKPSSAEALPYYEEGKLAYDRGDYEGAVRAFEKGIAIEPEPTLFFNVAQAFRKAGRSKDAVFYFRKYLAAQPGASKDVEGYIRELEAVEQPRSGSGSGVDWTGVDEAQRYFDDAAAAQLRGDFTAAAQGFERAFTHKGLPQFLYNAAVAYDRQAQRETEHAARVHDLANALRLYRRYREASSSMKDPSYAKEKAELDGKIRDAEAALAREGVDVKP